VDLSDQQTMTTHQESGGSFANLMKFPVADIKQRGQQQDPPD
jgi:hypothetical protein